MAEALSNTSIDGYEAAFEAFGVHIGVSTNDARVWARLPDLVPPYSQPCDPGEVEQHFSVTANENATFTVRYDVRDGVPARSFDAASWVATQVDMELAVGLLDTHVHGSLALNAADCIFIESGVVADNGRAILLPGPALSGKTTLVAALVNAGCAYYSDQYAVLDARGRVHPYARPVAFSSQNHGHAATPLPVGAVVATSYRPGAEWRPKRLSPGAGVLTLLANAVPAQHRTEEAMQAIRQAVRHDPVMVTSDRDEADALAPSLLAELGRESAATS